MFKCKLPPSNKKSQHQRSSSPSSPHTFTTPELTGAEAGAGAGVPPPETFTLIPLDMCSGTPPLNPGDIEDSDPSAIWENKSIRHAFIRKVFLILALQLLVTTSIVAVFTFFDPLRLFIIENPFVYAMSGRPFSVDLILLIAYTLTMSLCFGSLSRRVLEVKKKRRRVRTERRIRWWTLKDEDCSVRLREEVRQGPDSQTVKCAVGTTDWFKVEDGLHQGSVLSPFLFAVVMDRLVDEVRQESPWTMMSAYDIVICGESREQVEKSLESVFETKTVFLFLVMMVVVCVAITVFSFQTKVDFTSRPGLFCILCIVLLITGITTAIVLSFQYIEWLSMLYTAIGVVFFTRFLLFHTRLMVEKRIYELKPEEYLFGALTLFLITPNICGM
ncbi:protein lifeguard 3 [Silurus asotus]|uniref:Protein lifeguard 3 n=1 Tax=Silurus asotus TaxID=30991 RepID=A0AAD5ASW1_SILAS|nr:protein lifeguard 3 [Silurus asotus]